MESTEQTQENIKGLIKATIKELGEAGDLADYHKFNTKTHEIISHLFVLEDLKEIEEKPVDMVIKALDTIENICDNQLQKVIMKKEDLNEVYENIVSSLQSVVE